MLVKEIPIKTYIKGRGLCYQKGDILFLNTLKSLDRNLKDVKPKGITLEKQGLGFGEGLLEDNKKEIRNIIRKEGIKMMKKLSGKSIEKKSITDNTNKKKVSNKVQTMLDSLILDGGGLKITN